MGITLAGSLNTFDEDRFRASVANVLRVSNESIVILGVVEGSVTVSFEVDLGSAEQARSVQQIATELYLSVDVATSMLSLPVERIEAPVLDVASAARMQEAEDEEGEEDEEDEEDESSSLLIAEAAALRESDSDSGADFGSQVWLLLGFIAGGAGLLGLLSGALILKRRWQRSIKQADVVASSTSVAQITVASSVVDHVDPDEMGKEEPPKEPPAYESPPSQPDGTTIHL
jgi:hypothetical protein